PDRSTWRVHDRPAVQCGRRAPEPGYSLPASADAKIQSRDGHESPPGCGATSLVLLCGAAKLYMPSQVCNAAAHFFNVVVQDASRKPQIESPFPYGSRVVFLDLETTGANADRDRIAEIGLLEVVDGQLVGEWSSLVDPGRTLSPVITSLTGITDQMLA